jgi:hypothetical protein
MFIRKRVGVVPTSARRLMPAGEEERYAHAENPLRGAIGTLYKVVCANLQIQILGAQPERLADIRAHRNGPCVGGVGRPVIRDGGIAVDGPTALEAVADFRLEVGLIHAAAVTISGKRHELVCEDCIEPRAL